MQEYQRYNGKSNETNSKENSFKIQGPTKSSIKY